MLLNIGRKFSAFPILYAVALSGFLNESQKKEEGGGELWLGWKEYRSNERESEGGLARLKKFKRKRKTTRAQILIR